VQGNEDRGGDVMAWARKYLEDGTFRRMVQERVR
jgi:hypothetical protein